MGDELVLQNYIYNYHELISCNSGAVLFQVKTLDAKFWLIAKERPYKELYEIRLGTASKIVNLRDRTEVKRNTYNLINGDTFESLWLTWYNCTIRLGRVGQMNPVLEFISNDEEYHNQIGYIKFNSPATRFINVTYKIEVPPNLPFVQNNKKIEGGQLHWEQMNRGTPIPIDALIGGFDQKEPIYIARALHRNSLCPGKYLRSKGCSFIPWGFLEHVKNECEVLCGYDFRWVKTEGDNIPTNAFVAGYSEVRREPLYVGRAMYEGNLLVGKVHVLYKTCYLPYDGREIQVTAYEILVLPHESRQLFTFSEDVNI